MQTIFKNVLFLLFSISISEAQFCASLFNCDALKNPKNGIPTGVLQCALPALPTAKINAIDVFDANGELKTYFGTGETVFDVLGWMSEGAIYPLRFA